jgi:leukotriene-A4 hydrolase
VDVTFGPEVEPFGRPLIVPLADTPAGSSIIVSVTFSTTPESAAVQWLSPEQTAGKVQPYLFTQCQAIHARSLLPCQDTPSVKATYSATVEVPEPMCAVMSALPATPAFSAAQRSDWRVYSFHQPVPMASYLIALGVGNLASREVGPRVSAT